MAFIGVRISWLMLARNWLFRRVALLMRSFCSASSSLRARRSSAWRRTVMSRMEATCAGLPSHSSGTTRISQTRGSPGRGTRISTASPQAAEKPRQSPRSSSRERPNSATAAWFTYCTTPAWLTTRMASGVASSRPSRRRCWARARLRSTSNSTERQNSRLLASRLVKTSSAPSAIARWRRASSISLASTTMGTPPAIRRSRLRVSRPWASGRCRSVTMAS